MTAPQPRRIAVLGSTGSIGTQALDVIAHLGWQVVLLTANRDAAGVETQARRFRPAFCALADPAAAADLARRLADTDVRVLSGADGIVEGIRLCGADCYLNAILGEAGLAPTLAAAETGGRIALANKESLVVAGALVRAAVAEHGAELIPVDSEHSAIFQSLQAGRQTEVKRLLLTASGGPFFGYDRARLANVTAADTLRHPTWQMGAKITVDSATLMNKGFEVIEAAHLFDIPPERITVLVHRESIIHSAVEYIDNTVIAELSQPDMRTCIQYALTYPERKPCHTAPLDLFRVGSLTFAEPDPAAFPLLPLACAAYRRGGATPAVLNAANEVAVAHFLRGDLSFLGISDTVSEVVARLEGVASGCHTLPEILDCDRQARALAESRIRA